MKNIRLLIAILVVFTIVLSGCAKQTENKPANATSTAAATNYEGLTVKLGVQGSGGLFGKAREEKWFETEFEKLGVKVEWSEFQSGPPMTEAMASNRLDFAGLGNMPVVAAQAADIPFKIISQILDGKKNVALIVPTNSPVKKLEDLKGKKIAVAKGSNAFNFLYRSLEQSGLKTSEVEVIQLQPDEAQPAFENGGVDAWATWDPYITLNTLNGKGRVLADGEALGVLSPSFNIVRKQFAEKYPDLVTLYLKVLEKTRLWENDNKDEALKRYAAERKVPVEVIKGTFERSTMINIATSKEIAAELQKTADFQFGIKSIRKQIQVADIIDNQYVEKALKQIADEKKK
ncbi:aliphatic sulfonate ABC transporter substrate-binding protein [Paenibacillus qinlingensis]|uniref:aliphatic sulfonate ABC transporter substrate-binding protein n=1 Tax=Paenibacillus qinlingensis TaxID=1837343 RepID=UPI0015662D16|nr:aliphatic sulfonate ABC transporter substrate-binding protein [Paenibacillus qinlingensis]NQX61275.1 aliphatic sulfonate ABC transporter substrate-binding protein [Paenibacillus qinlingensis]